MGLGESVIAMVPMRTMLTTIRASGRQRREGSWPLGNSRAKNTMSPTCATQTHEET